jgi:hypothetical protein
MSRGKISLRGGASGQPHWPMSLRKQLIVITRPRRSSTEIGAPSTARLALATAAR